MLRRRRFRARQFVAVLEQRIAGKREPARSGEALRDAGVELDRERGKDLEDGADVGGLK